jgi:cytochrome b pre-mRNA-processing protein 3
MITLFKSKSVRDAAELAYGRVVEQARRPGFFIDSGVPDTLDGRFELICLHAFLYLHRLKREEQRAAPLGQRFFDTMFADFDRSLREMGTGDLSVGREIKGMAEAFYGRIAAYEQGLAGDDSVLQPALARNLFGTAPPTPPRLAAMARYARRELERLNQQDAAELLAGQVRFGDPPCSTAVPGAISAVVPGATDRQ